MQVRQHTPAADEPFNQPGGREATDPIREIDGRWLYYMFLAGTRNVVADRKHLNRINVFPVKDGDTGANMAFTLGAVVASVRPERPYKQMLDRIAETALTNARGNSGMIFAQFLFGVSSETGERASVSIEPFTASVKNAVRYIYQAVADPMEGTLLTIVRAWADFIDAKQHRIDDFGQLFVESKAILEKVLAETPLQLDVLAGANVVVDDTRILVSVSTLKYMVRGGRVSPLKGLLANLLNLKPIVSIDTDGNSMVFGKPFSQKANMKKVMAHIHRTSRDRAIWNCIVLHANNRPAADWYTRQMTALTAASPVARVNISPVIGASAGLGAASVAFMFG
ncbi:hypothetical protein DSCA_58710 [Desulfosarcina alkanivorans]|uniref:DhaL domain-containing protein n=1 Tax=Desulfosarcina alkanivorans TaxID=571177 RepID=A0A5K7YXW4_9BACT|nr:DegV family protein [Desulfosarcina alkanivorans]BBO71941.1 hypothetical protein DSCA_58710 [Desulfosarcina alkanivorans]